MRVIAFLPSRLPHPCERLRMVRPELWCANLCWAAKAKRTRGERDMQQPGLHDRHRDKNGEISKKHGNTLISALRKT